MKMVILTQTKLMWGDYFVKEINPPTGYAKNDQAYPVKVTEKNDDDNPAVVTIPDQPKDDPINFEVKKVDKETGETVQGDANLSGAEFTVKSIITFIIVLLIYHQSY